ncbi:DUF624 domain-containing protein [Acholeplasma granularum]|uniref:DUF624 domain-containing protein n=1 Tax=Acholeplasma granularum TaxID=264635 RepID=UPI00047158CA|nr:DUF624 domain-containing protein [Acholeplasma granularum]
MSFFERYVNSKFYHFTDFLFKLLLINVLMIFTSILGLFIIGLPIALLAGILTIRTVLKKGSPGVFKLYFKYVKYVFNRSIVTIILFILLLSLLGFNTYFFYSGLEPFSWYYFLSFMLMILLFMMSLVSFIHALMLSSVYELTIKSLFKHSYLLTIGFSVRGLLFLVATFMIVYTIILVPILGILVGLSSFSLLIYGLLVQGYSKIEALENELNELMDEMND